MSRVCLICNSKAVLNREVARGLALLIGLVDGAIQGARSANDKGVQSMLTSGLAAVTPSYLAARAAADDAARYHFASFDCLCLRCGAVFDENAPTSEGLSRG